MNSLTMAFFVMRPALFALLLLVSLAGWTYAVADDPGGDAASKGQKPDPQEQSSGEADTSEAVSEQLEGLGPIGVFADIEEGWKKEKLGLILRHYGRGKVAISIDGGPTGGAFSKNQSHYLFKDLFKYTITKKFEFVQYRNVSDGRGKVYAVAVRSYKRNDDGRLFEDKIYVSLQIENDAWVISEIKSIR